MPETITMRGIAFYAIILGLLAVTDAYFSIQLLAAAKADAIAHQLPQAFAVEDLTQRLANASTLAATEVDMVEQALNSRYMQWGAVGVMLALFVWMITRLLPAQEKRRDAERKADREANAEERQQERTAFLAAIEKRDQMYLGTLSDIRRSVETHAENNQKAKEQLSTSVHELTLEIRESRR